MTVGMGHVSPAAAPGTEPGTQEGLRSVEVHELGQARYAQSIFKGVKNKADHFYK